MIVPPAVSVSPVVFVRLMDGLAVAYGRLGMHHEAVATVRKAVELEPSNPYHLETLGWLQLDQSLLASPRQGL